MLTDCTPTIKRLHLHSNVQVMESNRVKFDALVPFLVQLIKLEHLTLDHVAFSGNKETPSTVRVLRLRSLRIIQGYGGHFVWPCDLQSLCGTGPSTLKRIHLDRCQPPLLTYLINDCPQLELFTIIASGLNAAYDCLPKVLELARLPSLRQLRLAGGLGSIFPKYRDPFESDRDALHAQLERQVIRVVRDGASDNSLSDSDPA